MSTEKQKAANKLNAEHSTGPTSEHGAAISALNNWRHGMATKTHEHFGLLLDENQEKFDELLNTLCQAHQPTHETECILVRHMAESEWLRARALRFQAELMNNTKAENVDTGKLAVFIRYQTTHERAFHRALNELLSLRKQKQNAEIGFESQRLKQAADVRANEVVNLKKEELQLKKVVIQIRQEAHERRNPPAAKPVTPDSGLEMAA